MVFIKVKENDDIVDKNITITTILFQCFVYKMLYIRRGVYITYKINIKTFHSFLTDKDKTVSIVGIHYKLEKEVHYVDDYKVFLSSNRIDNLLL